MNESLTDIQIIVFLFLLGVGFFGLFFGWRVVSDLRG